MRLPHSLGKIDNHGEHMSNSNQKALKSGAWYIVANFLTAASSFLTTPVFTRLLTREQYGMYNNFTSWQSILAILCTFNVSASLISARYDYEDHLDQYIFSAIGMSAASVLIWTVFLNLFPGWSQNLFSLSMTYLNLMMAHILFMKVFEMFQAQQRYFFKYKLQVALSVLSTFLSLGLSLILVTNMEDKLSGRIIGSVLPSIVIGFFIFIVFWVKGKRIRFGYWKYTLKICLPYIPHLLSMTVLNSTDRIMITKICGAADNALYSLAYTCGSIITILLTSINTAFSPWLAERIHEDDTKSVRSFSKYYIISFVCIAIGVMLVAPEVLYILGGKEYLAAIYVMPPVAMGCICQFLYTMMVNIEQIKRKTVGMALASMAAAVLNYVLNLLLIPRFGYIAAAYTTLAGFLLLLALHMWIVYQLRMSSVYSYRFIIGTVIAAFAITLGINAVYMVTAIRYMLLLPYAAVLAVILYRNRDKIFGFILSLKAEGKSEGRSE